MVRNLETPFGDIGWCTPLRVIGFEGQGLSEDNTLFILTMDDWHVWLTCMVHMYGSHVWFTCMIYMYGSHVWFTCMVHMYDSHVWFTCVIRMFLTFASLMLLSQLNLLNIWYCLVSTADIRCQPISRYCYWESPESGPTHRNRMGINIRHSYPNCQFLTRPTLSRCQTCNHRCSLLYSQQLNWLTCVCLPPEGVMTGSQGSQGGNGGVTGVTRG